MRMVLKINPIPLAGELARTFFHNETLGIPVLPMQLNQQLASHKIQYQKGVLDEILAPLHGPLVIVMKVLIVEDEPKTSAYLKRGLEENGFVTDLAGNGEDGAHLAQTGSYDLIVLDEMLPARDGWSIIAELRRREIATPVLFLTARDGVQDRVKDLELGADDYLVKPFAFSELLARVRSILRRSSASSCARNSRRCGSTTTQVSLLHSSRSMPAYRRSSSKWPTSWSEPTTIGTVGPSSAAASPRKPVVQHRNGTPSKLI
jgi:CheY-like chemotaxis protein